ncbi:MAG: hypothetical protein KKF50_05640 [Nanoarchaeota archaeon]|nr:hypothetical protein [Nanoarchaeota archaeon]
MGDAKKFFIKHHICIIALAGIAIVTHFLLLSGKYVINVDNPIANIVFIQSTILILFAIIFITYLVTRNAFERIKKKRK